MFEIYISFQLGFNLGCLSFQHDHIAVEIPSFNLKLKRCKVSSGRGTEKYRVEYSKPKDSIYAFKVKVILPLSVLAFFLST